MTLRNRYRRSAIIAWAICFFGFFVMYGNVSIQNDAHGGIATFVNDFIAILLGGIFILATFLIGLFYFRRFRAIPKE